MSTVRRSRHAGGATVLVMLLLSGVLAGVAGAKAPAPGPVEIGAPAGVPPSAHVTDLQSVSCVAAGVCVAFGWYSNTPGKEEAMAVSQAGGVWAAGGLAVVSYLVSSERRAVVLSQLAGVWGVAGPVEPPPPSGLGTDAVVDSLSCPAVGACVAFSAYQDSMGRAQLAVVSQTTGVWGVASRVALPSNAYANPHPEIGPVSCVAPGSCAALGTYEDTEGVRHAMALSERGGVWGRAREVLFPRDAGTPAYRLLGRGVESISCTTSGLCAAIGQYRDKSNHAQIVVVSRTKGIWGTAKRITLPATVPLRLAYEVQLNSVSCARSGYCAAVGTYEDRLGRQHAMVLAGTDGHWGGAAQKLVLPPGAGPEAYGATLSSVSCAPSGACVAVGSYEDTSGNGHTMIVSEVHGRWGVARNAGPPLNLELEYERPAGSPRSPAHRVDHAPRSDLTAKEVLR
jgi:hypothetical protein